MPMPSVRYEVDAGIATLALDDPDTLNALSDEMLDGLQAAFERAKADADVRCVVLTSTHDKVFSSGGNLRGFAQDEPLAQKFEGIRRFPDLFRTIGELGKPTICAANGHVLAGALGLALAGADRTEVPVAGIKGRKRTVFFIDGEAAADVPENLRLSSY